MRILTGEHNIKTVIMTLGLSALAAQAFEIKPCGELKSEIAAKLDGKGVKDYRLDIVASPDAGQAKVVGTCEGGTKKITYSKGGGVAAKTPQSDQAVKPSPTQGK
jgi:hypothetical protein